jgi:hypothetical protein
MGNIGSGNGSCGVSMLSKRRGLPSASTFSVRPRLLFYSGLQHEYNTIAKTLFIVLL